MRRTEYASRLPLLVLLLLGVALTGCATTQTRSGATVVAPSSVAKATRAPSPAHPGLAVARDMLGKPYRYGGASPRGFDCSGLVYYSYRRAGITVPRTSSQQYRHSEPVRLSRLRPGDLVFFRLSGNKLSHVGIYSGGNRFVHAPSSGKRVSYASLDNPYWRSRLIGAGRF